MVETLVRERMPMRMKGMSWMCHRKLVENLVSFQINTGETQLIESTECWS